MKTKSQNPKLIAQGAEAKIFLNKNEITKQRISKSYRIPKLDNSIRKQRTKAEAKILEKASKIIDVPKVLGVGGRGKEGGIDNSFNINMEFIDGKRLSEKLDSFPLKEQKKIMNIIGNSVAKIHNQGIIHNDLTTSNMIYKNNKVYFIDFGLGFQNGKIEDKGVDIHLLKQALEAKHFKNWKILFNEFEKSYKKTNKKEFKKIFERLDSIEKRGRYRH